MGVPSFFQWLTNKYPGIVFWDEKQVVDNFYFDFNGVIHTACRKILDSKLESYEDIEGQMIDAIIKYSDEIINTVKPKNKVLISIDGVAPRAKMNQQRQRRYKSVQERKLIEEIKKSLDMKTNITWDTNAITPGTKFMKRLSDKLEKHYNDSKYIISDASKPGEGEHKIMDYIRKNNKEGENNIVYGLDADLIFLTFGLHIEDVYLFREMTHFNRNDLKDTDFCYLSISLLKSAFKMEMEDKLNEEIEDIEKYIDDFILLCFLMGNDFLPHIPSLEIKNKGLDSLIDVYCSKKRMRTDFFVNNGNINKDFFNELLQDLSDDEEETLIEMQKKREHWKKISRSFDKTYTNEYEKQITELRDVSDKYQDVVRLGKKGYKSRYYDHYFNINNQDLREYNFTRRKIVYEFIRGMQWVLDYYFGKQKSWSWYYPYTHAPFISDIRNNLKYVKFPIIFEKDKPVKPFEQLMIVLPSDSKDLLPNSYAKKMIDPESDIIDYYPIDFDMDIINKRYLYECIPYLPVINMKRLQSSISLCELNQEESKRNSNN